jgi:hypothetical protein
MREDVYDFLQRCVIIKYLDVTIFVPMRSSFVSADIADR